MVLISRIYRLFQADLHAVIDRVEEPDSLLRQAVREMEELIARDEQRHRLLLQEQRQIDSDLSGMETKLHNIGEELDVLFMSKKEELARKLIRRRLEAQQFSNFLAHKRNTLAENIKELGTRLERNQERLDSMRQKAELFNLAGRKEHTGGHHELSDFQVPDEDVEIAFLHEKQKRSRP